jgi:hypothetical protein
VIVRPSRSFQRRTSPASPEAAAARVKRVATAKAKGIK